VASAILGLILRLADLNHFNQNNQAYPTLGHSMVDEELQYFQQWILNRLGISGATETARPSSSPHHKDLQ
jgi:hypothetical protein